MPIPAINGRRLNNFINRIKSLTFICVGTFRYSAVGRKSNLPGVVIKYLERVTFKQI